MKRPRRPRRPRQYWLVGRYSIFHAQEGTQILGVFGDLGGARAEARRMMPYWDMIGPFRIYRVSERELVHPLKRP